MTGPSRAAADPGRTAVGGAEPEVALAGGNMTPVVRVGDTVRRRAGPWTPTIHALLRHVRAAGFTLAPDPLGLDGSGREILSLLPGRVATYPLPAFVLSDAMLATYDVGDLEAMKKYSAIQTDAAGVITRFEEKPEKPETTLTGIALYYFAPATLELFTTYIAAGNNPDQPGRFIQWLYSRLPVKTYQIKGTWYDIGSKETLEKANKIFAEFVN